MQAQVLKQWMNDPGQMNRESMIQLKALLDEYPCFSIARVLYLKVLHDLGDVHFPKALFQAAIAVPDRCRLYSFIEGRVLGKKEIVEERPSGEDGFLLIDQFLHEAESKGLKLPEEDNDLIAGLTEADCQKEKPVATEVAPESPAFDEQAVHPISCETPFALDYLDYLSCQPDVEVPEQSAEPMHGQEWIDAFLTKSNEDKKIIPMRAEVDALSGSEIDSAELLNIDSDFSEDSFTQTLAKIYLKQKRYDRALEIFKNLSLKYPEKNVYFADQIRFLEKLIINIKNK
jgi:hypothetical protein